MALAGIATGLIFPVFRKPLSRAARSPGHASVRGAASATSPPPRTSIPLACPTTTGPALLPAARVPGPWPAWPIREIGEAIVHAPLHSLTKGLPPKSAVLGRFGRFREDGAFIGAGHRLVGPGRARSVAGSRVSAGGSGAAPASPSAAGSRRPSDKQRRNRC